MEKSRRHEAILGLIRREVISSQEALKQELHVQGFDVTQATLSRDLRELGVSKQVDAYGVYKYAVAEPPRQLPYLSYQVSGNLLVLKTETGLAPRVAYQVDGLGYREILGTVAGEDTLLVVLAEDVERDVAVEKILDGIRSE